jgi:hypothetical protein
VRKHEGSRKQANWNDGNGFPFTIANEALMNQNHTAISSQQFTDTIYPALNDEYSFRQDMSGKYWFMSNRSNDSVFALKFSDLEEDWTVRAVVGGETERRLIEERVRELCSQKS